MLLLPFALLALAASPLAEPPPAAPAPSHVASGKVASSDEVICRSDPQIGSHISSRTCHTRGEWLTIERNLENRRAANGSQNSCDAMDQANCGRPIR